MQVPYFRSQAAIVFGHFCPHLFSEVVHEILCVNETLQILITRIIN